ncbi:hypothetical protein [Listeria newyorkensis]|uniref:Uncharacterized protein n=1 Tax=Listeria newyorkensis TaxID=1497681 RepID=A0A841YZR4_9LIST|nr:hypothetical protein [Listeria newyorkensis]MBC1459014.1 hypothetical protein [Listeria newyorkensis]
MYNYLLSTDDYKFGNTKLEGSYGKDISEIKLSIDGNIVQTTTIDRTQEASLLII